MATQCLNFATYTKLFHQKQSIFTISQKEIRYSLYNAIFVVKTIIMTKELNRLKVVLAEKKVTNRLLAEKMGEDEATVSNWCTNKLQPNLETLIRMSEILGVEVQDLIRVRK